MVSTQKIDYEKNGYVIIDALDLSEFNLLSKYTVDWVRSVIQTRASQDCIDMDLESYHIWGTTMGIEHDGLFAAKNRYVEPENHIVDILHCNRLMGFLHELNPSGYDQWQDPGYGWFGYRLIRPGFGDGYPPSCKNWGAAAGVISIWLPILGFDSSLTLALIPGSHKKEYEKFLPENQKFTTGEYRLAEKIPLDSFFRPTLKPGQLLVYHPGLIHTENVVKASTTRVNVEYRFMPKGT